MTASESATSSYACAACERFSVASARSACANAALQTGGLQERNSHNTQQNCGDQVSQSGLYHFGELSVRSSASGFGLQPPYGNLLICFTPSPPSRATLHSPTAISANGENRG